MAIYELTTGGIRDVEHVTFADARLRERQDLQRLIRERIDVVVPDVKVIAEEYGDWVESRRRIDLLGLDTQGNLVVIELKRTEDGGHMELQALRYAAMVAPMTFEQLVQAHQADLNRRSVAADARTELQAFLSEDRWGDVERDVRIVLVSAEFSKELTTSVMWLNNQGLEITCVRTRLYRLDDRFLLDVQQLVPLPEAADYQVRIREKEQAERQERIERRVSGRSESYRQFFQRLIDELREVHRFTGVRVAMPQNWYTFSTGHRAFGYGAVFGGDGRFKVELYIDTGDRQANIAAFGRLRAQASAVEAEIGESLEWDEIPGKRACRIACYRPGSITDSPDELAGVHNWAIAMLLRFRAVFGPRFDRLELLAPRAQAKTEPVE